MNNQTYLTKTAGKLRSVFLLLLVAVFSLSGVVTANAATIGETGEYALVLQNPNDEWEGCFDGEYATIVRFNVAEGETTVKLSELTKGIVPFNGKTEFSHWRCKILILAAIFTQPPAKKSAIPEAWF